MKLILFDIDGTLIRSNGAGRAAIATALESLFGKLANTDDYRMGGKTDPRIITDLLTAHGVDAKTITERLPDIYELIVENAQRIYPQKGITTCPGVPQLLQALRRQPNVVLGLLTGNIAATAPLKLRAGGIDPGQFRVGAYGSDHIERNRLPEIVIRRANELTGTVFTGKNTVIVGDTPADILCARAGQATAVAVASGWHSANTLSCYHPDYLFDNLTETDTVLEILLN